LRRRSVFQEIARFSARENHFPDIGIHKGRIVDVAWYTYAIGGLSRNDFIDGRTALRVALVPAGRSALVHP